MGKVKNKAKKKNLSDRKTTSGPLKKVMNPFEVHVNKQKYNVLGRKLKHDIGLPGVSRMKAINKRKRTLLQEYKVRGKANQFVDRRIGETNRDMTREDRIMARFTAERIKMHNKKSIFNLADDQVLTHRGQTLSEIEKFEDPRSDEEEDEEKLSAGFVEDVHFGGGILKKSNDEFSRKDLIEQLIAESKKRKAEKQQAREQTVELTEKLDTEWKDLLPLMSAGKSTGLPAQSDKPDPYDTVMRQLKFEARGKPSDRLKSEEELAKEEKERLENLEAERLKHMHGEVEESPQQKKHRSADDLDDGFVIESDEDVMVTYNVDGQIENPIFESEMSKDEADEVGEDIQIPSDSGEDNSSDEQSDSLSDLKGASQTDEDEEGSPSAIWMGEDKFNNKPTAGVLNRSHSPVIQPENSQSRTEEPWRSEIASKHSGESQSSKTQPIDHASSSEHLKNLEQQHISKQQRSLQNTIEQQESFQNVSRLEAVRADLLKRKTLMDQARKELPYTFQVPDSYEELQKLFSVQSYDHRAVILERMIKCNHPSLGEGYKDKLANLFAFLLQHLQDEALSPGNCFALLDCISPFLYDLAHVAPETASHCMAEVIKEKQQDLRLHPKVFPGLDTLVFLKLVSLLFPTSDFRHPVVTPALVLMCQILHQCRLKAERDIAVGLYLSTLMLEYTVLSKRFSPSCIYFLHKTVSMAVPGANRNLLVLQSPAVFSSRLMNLEDLKGKCDEDFKVCALHTAVKLLLEFCDNLQSLPMCYQIFQPVLHILQKVQSDQYPDQFRDDLNQLVSSITAASSQKLQYLVHEKKKPKALRLYKPRIQDVFDFKFRRPMSQMREEQEKLRHKYKRELKGAVREIRRDKSFLANLQLRQTLQSDRERKQKVKEILGSASMQQGELRRLKRKRCT